MDKIFLLGAYYAYEGTTPIRAFASEEEAKALADVGNAYQKTIPEWDGSVDFRDRKRLGKTHTQ